MSRFDRIGRELPRVPFGHAIISPTCRQVQTDALAEAVERLRHQYDDVVSRYPGEVNVHVLLLATWPKDEPCSTCGLAADDPEALSCSNAVHMARDASGDTNG